MKVEYIIAGVAVTDTGLKLTGLGSGGFSSLRAGFNFGKQVEVVQTEDDGAFMDFGIGSFKYVENNEHAKNCHYYGSKQQ